MDMWSVPYAASLERPAREGAPMAEITDYSRARRGDLKLFPPRPS